MDHQLRRGFLIGAFEIEPLTGRIAGPSGETRVQPKVMDVLVLLAQHAGELVERDTLLEQVWRRVSSEEVLTRCISELRAALGDDRGKPRYIQTVPKRGSRLLERAVPKDATARNVSEPTAGPTITADVPARPPAPSAAMASIAVLPFETHSVDPAHQFLGDAFAAELQSTLARVDRLRVASLVIRVQEHGGRHAPPFDFRRLGMAADVHRRAEGSRRVARDSRSVACARAAASGCLVLGLPSVRSRSLRRRFFACSRSGRDGAGPPGRVKTRR